HNGERVGDGSPPQVDIAVDPVEGTRPTALGMPNALAVIALAERGVMFDPGPCVYMEKMASAAEFGELLDLDRPLGDTVQLITQHKGTSARAPKHAMCSCSCSSAGVTPRGSPRSAR